MKGSEILILIFHISTLCEDNFPIHLVKLFFKIQEIMYRVQTSTDYLPRFP